MPYEDVGTVTANATSDWLSFGLVSAPLDGGFLKLELQTLEPADPTPLGFLIVHPVAAVDGGGVPPGTYYPSPLRTLLTLGPGVGERFVGELRCRVRRYNLRWLEAGVPGTQLVVVARAWVPENAPVPLLVGPAVAGGGRPLGRPPEHGRRRGAWPAPEDAQAWTDLREIA